ncbi:folate-binding protein [Demequina sp. TTPB684]|uniref:CAF17-like 4Fe-4S cluster assembly/insertion protein YgfZ n=1 Tax=unclassified Demequina TaxID=2620311 RepID=UPI001CF2D67A|nr:MULTISPECIES: folate-binding protein [unclassified Demequina]MCB2413225.1 folate-binding protein [Demequina sp. TTPB684]UPU88200.1 folate-binding protein [Demequina sp. TMPB413]
MTSALVASSPLLSRQGAVAATGPDAGVAWHYGDPTAEQRSLEAGAGVVDQSHLGVVTVTGPDRLTWLNSLTTQEVASLAPEASTELMILNPQGRIEHVAAVVDDGETAWLITETAEGLAAFLDRMRFMLRVEVADVTAQWAAIGEPRGTSGSGPADAVTWVDQWPHVGPGGTSYTDSASAEATPRPWRLTLVPRAELESAIDARVAAGARLAGTWASEALRIAAHRPRAATEIDETTLPHELDWLRTAVHLHKGCYRGQETVAKVHNVGRPPRRLTMLHLDGSDADLPALGAAVTLASDGKPAGRVTSVARHHELGPIALAVLKRSTDPTAVLEVQGEDGPIAAAQEIIVNAEGFSADRPPKPGPTTKGLLMGKGCAADGGDL